MRKSNIKKMILCEGRHPIPQATDGAVFNNTLNPTDIEGMKRIVESRLSGVNNLDLYVTGLTVALVEVINYCHANKIGLTLYHYNRDTGNYYPQVVVERGPVDTEAEVSSLLHRVGMPANLKGYRYVRHAVIMTVHDTDVLNSMTGYLYPTVAEQFNTTPGSVERAIRHAIEVAWLRGNTGAVYELFGRTIDSEKGKPTNSEFIAMLADKVQPTTDTVPDVSADTAVSYLHSIGIYPEETCSTPEETLSLFSRNYDKKSYEAWEYNNTSSTFCDDDLPF